MATTASADAFDRGRLRSLPMFARAGDAELDRVLGRTAVVSANADEVLVAEGDTSDYAYVILAGSVSVTRRGRDLASLGVGDLFGEMAMVAGGIRTATVRATTAVELLRVDAQGIAELTGTETIAWNLLQTLLQRMARDHERPGEKVALDDGHTGDEGRATPLTPVGDEGPASTDQVGEHLRIAERVVVAPGIGVFRPCAPERRTAAGEMVAAGQVIGYVESLGDRAEVRTPFAGFLMGMLALDGERVRSRQPIAWLRTF